MPAREALTQQRRLGNLGVGIGQRPAGPGVATEIPVGEAPRPIWPVSVVISTSTNGRVLQSSTWRPTTDAIRIKGLPVPDDLSYNTATQTATKWQIAVTAVKP